MKKIFGAAVAAIVFFGSAFAFPACAGGGHTDHDFTGAWVKTDPEYHWHVCAAEGCEETDQKVAHEWVADESKTDVPATCISDGIRYVKCGCGATKSVAITDRPDHDFTGAWVKTDPEYHWHVCAVEGCEETDQKAGHNCNIYDKVDYSVHSKTCECGYAENEAHTWDEGTVTKEPNATEKGEKTFTCDVCHGTKTEVIPETSHVHNPSGDWKNDENVHWHTCDGCSEQLDKVGHTWVDDPSNPDVPATCHSDGTDYSKCSVCGATKSEAVTERPDHDFTGGWVTTDETWHYHKCANDGCEATDTKVEHTFTYNKEDADNHSKACTCGYSENEAHAWNDGEVTEQPTFWTEGSKNVTCEHCGENGTESVARLTSIKHKDVFTTENQDGDWSYGRVEINKWDADDFQYVATETETKTADAWTADDVEIKGDWLSVNAPGFVAFTAKEAVTVEFDIKVTKKTDKSVDARAVKGNQATWIGDNGKATFTLAAGETVYVTFSAGGGDGNPQAGYSIVVTRVA